MTKISVSQTVVCNQSFGRSWTHHNQNPVPGKHNPHHYPFSSASSPRKLHARHSGAWWGAAQPVMWVTGQCDPEAALSLCTILLRSFLVATILGPIIDTGMGCESRTFENYWLSALTCAAQYTKIAAAAPYVHQSVRSSSLGETSLGKVCEWDCSQTYCTIRYELVHMDQVWVQLQ